MVNEPYVIACNLGKTFFLKTGTAFLNFVFPKRTRNNSSFDNYIALENINFSLRPGQALGVIGKNGAGKSTLLQILSGILKPSSGTYKIEGKIASLLELGSGFNPDFTGRENIFLYASIFGISKSLIKNRVKSIIEFAEVEEFIDNPLRTYSSGMQMRLAFSIVSQLDAQILLIDEAFAVGDSFFVQKCFRFINEFKKTGILILVSHDHHSIVQFCDSCIWLEKGKMVSSGEPKKVVDDYLANILFPNKNKKNDSFDNKIQKAGFGSLKVKITSTNLVVNKIKSNSVKNDDNICLTINFKVQESLSNIVVGFIIRNKFGLDIFSDKIYKKNLNCLSSGSSHKAVFKFKMPAIKTGDYFICVALAECSLKKSNILHWINDVLKFKMSNSEIIEGVFKIDEIKSSFQKSDERNT